MPNGEGFGGVRRGDRRADRRRGPPPPNNFLSFLIILNKRTNGRIIRNAPIHINRRKRNTFRNNMSNKRLPRSTSRLQRRPLLMKLPFPNFRPSKISIMFFASRRRSKTKQDGGPNFVLESRSTDYTGFYARKFLNRANSLAGVFRPVLRFVASLRSSCRGRVTASVTGWFWGTVSGTFFIYCVTYERTVVTFIRTGGRMPRRQRWSGTKIHNKATKRVPKKNRNPTTKSQSRFHKIHRKHNHPQTTKQRRKNMALPPPTNNPPSLSKGRGIEHNACFSPREKSITTTARKFEAEEEKHGNKKVT